jgi:RND family efflux transporter MFP subunit
VWALRAKGAEAANKVAQTTCPVMDGQPIKKDVYVDYQGQRIYFCCPDCPEKFKADPEKYLAKTEAQKALYHCPMHPTYVSDHPGDCPICGMKLVPVEKAETMKGAGIPGHAPVRITPQMQQLIGVKTAKVEKRRIHKTIRAVGIVGYDETKLATMTMRYGGWIDKLFVNYTGQYVEKGAPMVTVYGPDLLVAEHEYLVALDGVKAAQAGGLGQNLAFSQSLLASSREKLKLYDLTDEQITELEKTHKPWNYTTLHSPITGYVIKRNVAKRSYVAMGQELYEIADLSTVWVNVDVYEYEVPLVKIGQEADVEMTSAAAEPIKGKVVFISPVLDNMTRTVSVRLEFPNPDLQLKPMMYGNVTIPVDLGEQLAVDESAVMFTGTEELAFVALGDGYFEPRKVAVGPRSENYYTIREGLKEGETVVVGANFLVDSESRLKAATMNMGAPAKDGKEAGQMKAHQH